MEILQLKYFYESAKNENFSKTAEKYIVPSTSVSAAIKRLETELGCTLFDRHSNSISLNQNGKRLVKSLEIVFNELNQAVEDLSSLENDKREIKILVRAMRYYITDAIIKFEKKYPHISFTVTLDFKEKNIEKYDIIIDETSNIYFEYCSFNICQAKLKLVTNPNNPLCNKRISLKNLDTETFVSWGEESNMHRILVNACKKAGFSPKISVMTNDMKCHEKLTEAGVGIGLEMETNPHLKKGAVNAINVVDFDETYTVCAYYKKEAAYGNISLFIKFLKEDLYQAYPIG